MKQLYFAISIAIIFLLTSCGSLMLDKELVYKTNQSIQLVDIGIKKNELLKSQFNPLGGVQLKENIAVNISVHDFSKSQFKVYQQAAKLQNKKVLLKYVDSLELKPVFIRVSVKDRVGVLKALKSSTNLELLNYIKSKPKSSIVMETAMVMPSQWMREYANSKGLFIVTNNNGGLDLGMYLEDGSERTISCSDATVFSYKKLSFCWEENNRGAVILQNFVAQGTSCGKGSSKKYENVVSNQYSFKY